MAAFLAFLRVRSLRAEHPSFTDAELVETLERVSESASGLDFRGGLALLHGLDPSLNWSAAGDPLRLFIFEWVKLVQPRWLRFVPYGRERVRGALGRDQAQCFREARLFEETPDDEAIQFWDRVAALMRGVLDAEKMERGRLAERLSLEHERQRLDRLGIAREPSWVALEDNTLGYDILSYDFDPNGRLVPRMIEVKSRRSDVIFLTRNEWNNAFTAAQQSVIHVWELPQQRLREFHPHDLAGSVPVDQGAGVWQNVRITLGAAPLTAP